MEPVRWSRAAAPRPSWSIAASCGSIAGWLFVAGVGSLSQAANRSTAAAMRYRGRRGLIILTVQMGQSQVCKDKVERQSQRFLYHNAKVIDFYRDLSNSFP